MATANLPPHTPNQDRQNASLSDHFAESVEAAAKKSEAAATQMADGTWRTANGVLVKPTDWRHRKTLPGKVYRALHRRYLRFSLRWPRWVPRALAAGLVLIVVVNAVVLTVYVKNRRLIVSRGTALPTKGVIQADGSKYDIADASWRLPGSGLNWSAETMNADGKRYSSSDATCVVQVSRSQIDQAGMNLDVVTSLAMQRYAINPASARAQVQLPPITIKSAQTDSRYEFVRHRYSYSVVGKPPQVSEVATRTLGKQSFAVVQTCEQSAWDQSQAARTALMNDLAITVR